MVYDKLGEMFHLDKGTPGTLTEWAWNSEVLSKKNNGGQQESLPDSPHAWVWSPPQRCCLSSRPAPILSAGWTSVPTLGQKDGWPHSQKILVFEELCKV